MISFLFTDATPKTMTGKRLLPGVSFSMLAAGILALLPCQARAGESKEAPAPMDPIVATINSEPVSAGEYRLIMERKTAEAFSYMKEHYDMDDHLGYWSEKSGAKGPLAKLRELIQEELVRIKVYQGLAKDRGLLKDTSFANFEAEFERENARRKTAKSAGQVVYGPKQYPRTAYYYILYGDLVFKLKQAMSKDLESKIPEVEIGKFYEENKAAFGDKSLADSRQRIVEVLGNKSAEKDLEAACASAKVKVEEPLLRTLVPRMDPE